MTNKVTTENLSLVLDEQYEGDPAKGFPPSCTFQIQLRSTGERIGHVTIRVGNDIVLREYAGHISYGIDEAHRGHRFAAEACKAILPIANSLGIDPIRITADPDNVASRRTCELAGGKYLGDVDVPPGNYVYENGGRRKSRYEFSASGPTKNPNATA